MRSIRLLVAGLTILAVAACATTTPGWTYAPASPSVAPSAGASASAAAPSGSATASASAGPSSSAGPSAAPSAGAPSPAGPAAVVDLVAENIAFTPTELSVAANEAFQIRFDNKDAGIPHNVAIKDGAGATVFMGDIFPGVEIRPYDVQPLAAGAYQFVCSVHPNMVGTLTVQ
jgi:plastocyanin